MNVILLSGGSGKRLWPLSNEARAKQFLKVLKTEEGQNISMLQKVFSQLKGADIDADITIAAASLQVDSIRRQLGNEVPLVVEPERRNTYPAIVLAMAALLKEGKVKKEDVVLVVPVDVWANEEYFRCFTKMQKLVEEKKADIALLGIYPTYPSAKYGYICVKKDEMSDVRMAEAFIEKPSEEKAEEYIKSGAFWNAGVFAVSVEYVLNEAKKEISDVSYEAVLKNYGRLENISFDYKLVEKAEKVAMVEYKGEWKDLGTWNTLTEEMEETCSGKTIVGEECENTHIINELAIPIVALGTKDLVIAASPDGILVSDKHKSSYLKPYVETLEERPMYEERRWGEYRVLDYTQYEDKSKSLTKHLMIEKGKCISYQRHLHRDEIWTIVDGWGRLLIDGEEKNVKRGDVAYIKAGEKHALYACEDLHFIEVQIGKELIEDDIERFEWNWEDI